MHDTTYHLSAGHDPAAGDPMVLICRRTVNGVRREAVFREQNHGWVNVPPDRREQAGITDLETVEISEEQAYQAIATRLRWLAAHGEDFTYFLIVDGPYGRSHPGGVLRRYEVNGQPHDEGYRFGGGLGGQGWWPTEFFDLYRIGRHDDEYIEVPAEEAEQAITDIHRRRSGSARP